MTDYQVRLEAVQIKSQTEAMLAAEAGYESAIFWMSQQEDILGSIQKEATAVQLGFANGATCSYTINFHGCHGEQTHLRSALHRSKRQAVFHKNR